MLAYLQVLRYCTLVSRNVACTECGTIKINSELYTDQLINYPISGDSTVSGWDYSCDLP